MKYFLIITLLLHLNAQTVHLNELVSSNSTTINDEDGDSPDWIEIHNASNEPIDLLDYGLSDDNENPYKWKFPSIQIAPDSYSIIFASNKDRSDLIKSWDAIFDIGDLWHYWVGNSAPILNWEQPETDISDWPYSVSGFGYGDSDDNTLSVKQLPFMSARLLPLVIYQLYLKFYFILTMMMAMWPILMVSNFLGRTLVRQDPK
jgi:hypothetical protein